MELSFDLTKQNLTFEEIVEVSKNILFNTSKYNIIYKTSKEKVFDRYVYERGIDNLSDIFLTLCENINSFKNNISEKDKQLLAKLYNKYIKFEKVNDKFLMPHIEEYDTYLGTSYRTEYWGVDIDGYVITNTIPEIWKNYVYMLSDQLDAEISYNNAKKELDRYRKNKKLDNLENEM